MTPTGIIDEIERIRAQNNSIWMRLVRLALEVAPERARAIFKEISSNDEEILRLSRRLADGE
jgi:hypothetical protein